MFASKFRYIFILFLLVFLSSCTAAKLEIKGRKDALGSGKKIALIAMTIAPPADLPTLPLIQAGLYKNSLYKVAEKINEIHKNKIDDLTESFGQKLKDYSNVDVLFGKLLIKSDAYINIENHGVKVYSTKTKHKKFTDVIIQDGSKNFFDFSERTDLNHYFDKTETFKENIVNIANALNVDFIAVADVTVNHKGVSILARSSKYILINFYIFDRQGKTVLSTLVSSKPPMDMGTTARDLTNYKQVLELFDSETDRLFEGIFAGKK